jgi:hypothetical protein
VRSTSRSSCSKPSKKGCVPSVSFVMRQVLGSSDSQCGPALAATVDRNMGTKATLHKRLGLCGWQVSDYLSAVRELGTAMNISAKMENIDVLRVKLAVLTREHRDLDEAIHALQERGSADMLTVRRLKKQKLALKDQITQLNDRILPDIIA